MRRAKTSVSANSSPVVKILRRLKATGREGFEGLVVSMLKGVVTYDIRLANSGLQDGLDAHSSLKDEFLLAVECKRYRDETPLSQRDLLSEVEAAYSVSPLLDCWILAVTREVTAQEERFLRDACEARGIAYLTLDCSRAPNVGLLDALCAFQSDRAVQHFRSTGLLPPDQIDEFASATEAVRTQRDAQGAYDRLQRQLSEQSVGFPQFRAKLNARVIADLTSPERCVYRFRCAMGPQATRTASRVIGRPRVLALLNQHWRAANGISGSSMVVVLGEEGAGKSWAVADWIQGLIRGDEPPAVFFISAGEPKSFDASRVLASHAAQYADMRNEELTLRRLGRWLADDTSQQSRRVLVVIDGLNERLEPGLWGPLLDDLRLRYEKSMHLVVTCRTQTWRETYANALSIRAVELEVGAFDETEFADAISGLTADRRDRVLKLGPLVRRPRYFHLACEYAEELVAFGELTIPMLYYYDWKHRHSRRPYQPISKVEFDRVLMELAQKQRDTKASFRHSEALQVLGSADHRQRLEDLASGGIISARRTGRLALQPSFLALGLGMYLASHLEDEGGTLAQRIELAQVLLGETSSWDFTSEVLQQALLHAMTSSPPTSLETQVAVLAVWGMCLNAAGDSASAVPQIAVASPELLLRYAEFAWGAPYASYLMETAVLNALVRLLRDSVRRGECVSRLTDWVGLTHELAEHPSDGGDPDVERAADVLRLCKDSAYAFAKCGVTLRRSDNRLSLRLGRLALAAISTADLRECWAVIKTAFVSDEAMGNPRGPLLAWIVRSAAAPIDHLVSQTVSDYIADNDPVAYRAAYRLLTACGAPSLMKRLDEIPADQRPKRSVLRTELESDPCTSFFAAPNRRQLPRCLEREDVPYHINAARARQFAADCDFQFPETFKRQVRRQSELLDVGKLRLQMGHGDQDLAWSDLLPLVARVGVDSLEDLVRRFASTAGDRSGLPLRQLSWSLAEFAQLLGPSEIEIVKEAWERHSSAMDVSSSDDLFVESALASIILPSRDSASAQVAFLLSRKPEASDLLSMSKHFKHVEPSDQRTVFGESICDDRAMRIALWMLNAQPVLDEALAAELVAGAASSDNSGTRGLALRLAHRISDYDWATRPEFRQWSAVPSMWPLEQFYGTMMVMCQSSEPDALERCNKQYLGQALAALDAKKAARWAVLFSQLVLRVCQRVACAASSFSHPPFEIEAGYQEHPWCRISLSRETSKTEMFFHPLSSWGGLAPGDFAKAFSGWGGEEDGRRRAAWDAAFDAAAAEDNWLFAAYIPSRSITRIVSMRPTFIEEMEQVVALAVANGRVPHIQPVLEALVRYGFKARLPQALRWYELLEAHCDTVRYVVSETGLASRQAAVLSAVPSTEMVAEWRRLISGQRTDFDLYRVLNGLLVGGNDAWIREEAENQIKSDSPRGRALGLIMLSALSDSGEHFDKALTQLAPPSSSWYSELGDLCRHYLERRSDQIHWLQIAITGGTARERVAAAVLAAHIEDPRTIHLMKDMTNDPTLPDECRRRAASIPLASERSSKSDWSKTLSERLFGSRIQEHAAHPWLPVLGP